MSIIISYVTVLLTYHRVLSIDYDFLTDHIHSSIDYDFFMLATWLVGSHSEIERFWMFKFSLGTDAFGYDYRLAM